MATMQDIVDRGRKPLNDAAKVRFTDLELVRYVNDFVQLARRHRPDLFFGSFSALPGDLVLANNYPLPIEYEVAAADYVTGRAETLGGEADMEARALLFLKGSAENMGG